MPGFLLKIILKSLVKVLFVFIPALYLWNKIGHKMTTINEIRSAHTKAPKFSTGNTHEAMIAKTWISKKKFTVGVNYWTPAEIAAGARVQTDGTRQEVIAPLYI